MGGLSKKAFQFNKIVNTAPRPHLILDAGALLFKHSTINPRQQEQEELTARAIIKAYNLIGYDAVCVGSQDLIAGIPYLNALRQDSKFPWLSANLVNKLTKKPLFTATTSIKLGSIKVGIIGLTGPAILEATDNAVILPWDQILPSLIAKMAKKNNLLILLSNLPATDNQQIAKNYANLHLIIQSGASSNTISPVPINNTIMVGTAPQGKQIGVMEINWQSSHSWQDPRAISLAAKKTSLTRLHEQLSRYQKDKNSAESLRNQPDLLRTYNLLLAQAQNLQGEIDLLHEKASEHAKSISNPSTYSNRFISMGIELPDHPEVSRIVATLDAEINAIGKRKAEFAAHQRNSPYLGSLGCGSCHAKQLASWQQSKHAQAYTTLTERKQQFNPDCLPCHVTGITRNQGADALALPETRRGVGCESCHGPGLNHSESPKTSHLSRKPGPAICIACHTLPHDDGFEYNQRIKQLKHH